MKLKKTALYTAIISGLSGISMGAQAALVTDTLLTFDSYVSCPIVDCTDPLVFGSYFALDSNGDGVIDNAEKTAMTPGYDGGIIIGRTQPGDIIIPDSLIYGGGIDEPWDFFGNTGWHETTSPVTEVNDLGTTRELDFSGWTMNVDQVGVIMLGGDPANFASDTGIAMITCATSACANGESYTLDYAAHISLGDPSLFGGTVYNLHLEGTISAVPVPAAVWLFGSGLIGLAGMVRKKKVLLQ